MPIASPLASPDHKNASRMSASRQGFQEKGEKKNGKKRERNSSLPVTIALAVRNYDFSLESKSNQRRVSRLYCAVRSCQGFSDFFFFPLPVWERLAFSLNGKLRGEQKGRLETKAAFAGFSERLQVSRLGVLLQEI